VLFDLTACIKRYWYPLAAGGLIICGVAARIALTLIGWPHTNSEEGTMGIEAMHILLRGEHPVYLYGQNYMGAGEAYLGALAFRLFGVSLVSLRLGMIAFYAVFMLGVFWIAHLLYSGRVALVSLAMLVLGTPFLLQIELLADGGKAETLAFGAIMVALASWLALSRPIGQTPHRRRLLRYGAFAAWGVISGLGLYSYAVIAPFVLTSGLLLWVTRRRELRGWVLALPLVGLLIGLLPVLTYTATMPFKDNPISVFLSLHHSLNAGGSSGGYMLAKQVVGPLLYTLPTVTGLVNLYPVQALPLYGPLTPSTFAAVLIGGSWSLGYLFLLGAATYRPWCALRQNRFLRRMNKPPIDEAQAVTADQAALLSSFATNNEARNIARLMLPLAAWLTLAAYMFSATAANNPYSGRYLIGLLIIHPAILWPLLDRTSHSKDINAESVTRTWAAILRTIWRPVGVALIGASLILGVIATAQAAPGAVVVNQKDVRFAHDLLSHGITRFYSDYWTCDLMNFATREQLVCAVIGEYAQPGLTRYHPYYATVRADKDAPYVLSHGSSIENTFLAHAAERHQQYQVKYVFGRYYVYTPKAS
jgi:hypothetical protein